MNRLIKEIRIDGLSQMDIHTGFPALFFIFFKAIGADRNDRQIVIFFLIYESSSLHLCHP